MKLTPSPRRRRAGLSLVGAMIIFGCIMILGYLLLRILIRAMDNWLPPPETNFPPPNDTNAVTSLPAYPTETFVSLPSFSFDVQEVSAMTATPSGALLIERSTNMVDWTPAWRISTMEDFNMLHDTNASPMAFYRAVLIP